MIVKNVAGNGRELAVKPERMPLPSSRSKSRVVIIPRPNIKETTLTLVGDSPLICHRWSEKQKQKMVEKQARSPRGPLAARNPQEEYEASLYPIPGKAKEYGFPAVAFKKSGVRACKHLPGLSMVDANGLFFVMAEHGNLVKLYGSAPRMREDTVNIGKGHTRTADVRYRGEFTNWWVRIKVRYDADIFTEETLAYVFERAGFMVGVGEMRPEKSGHGFGIFHVGRHKEVLK